MNGVVAFLPGVLAGLGLACGVAAFAPARPQPPPVGPVGGCSAWLSAVRDRLPPARAIAAAGAALVVWWATGWPVAAVATAAAITVLPRLLARHDAAEVIARLDALAAFARRLADTFASGAGGLQAAISAAARTPPDAIATEVGALAVRVRTRGLEPALRMFADELSDPAADEVVAALILRARAGGRGLTDVLDAKADALAAEAAARRDTEADRAKPRTDTRLVITITGLVLAALVLFAHDFLDPFTGLFGQLVMAAIAALMGLACWWMHVLSRARRNPRLFVNADGFDRVGVGR